jgi:predicted  nucleic acid-binding Zn-ribbon protein
MMSEDPTQNLPPRSFDGRVLTELAAMRAELTGVRQELSQLNSRLTSLEEKVDERLRETRPIREGVLQRLTMIEAELRTSIVN